MGSFFSYMVEKKGKTRVKIENSEFYVGKGRIGGCFHWMVDVSL
jgi:hypothetical protein